MNISRVTIAVLLVAMVPFASSAANWRLALPDDLADHGAVRIGVGDLREALERIGQSLEVGPAEDRPQTIRVVLDPSHPHDEGFEWRRESDLIALAARGPMGVGYGLCRMAWLSRSEGAFPPPDRSEAPELPFRIYSGSSVAKNTLEGPTGDPDDIARVVDRFKEDLGHVVRHGFNHLAVLGLEHYVPWDDPHYGPRSARCRAYLRQLIAEAHACGVNVLLGGDEAVYLPSDLEARGAAPSVKDPLFWEAMKDKYRRLLAALPELDGVVTRTGEQQPALDFRHIDIVYSPETSPDPRLEERSAAFLKSLHNVVAVEHNKLYVHRTWAVGDWGLHSVPEIYTRTLDWDLPVENFLVSIKATKQDQWFYGVAFNPTFGLTPHRTIVEGELHNQYHGAGNLIDYPGRWLAASVRYARMGGVEGIYARQNNPRATTPSAILYLWARLGWNVQADPAEIAREWVGHRFGPGVSDELTRLFLDSAEAIRGGLYLAPFLTVGWNPIPLIRTHQFIAQGNPLFDAGRGHDEFLRRHYLMCEPFFEETYEGAGAGCERIERMWENFVLLRDRIDSPEAAADLETLLVHTRDALALVRDYYRTFLGYGAFRETQTAENRDRLAGDVRDLEKSMARYRAEHDYYKLHGAELLVDLSHRFLEDPDRARRTLEEAPSPEDLRVRFAETLKEHDRRIAEAGNRARRVLSWKATVDFRILVHFQGNGVRYEILRGMAVGAPTVDFAFPIPERSGGEWLLKPVDVPATAFLLAAPSEDNDFTLTVYVDNPTPGSAHFAFEVYWIPEGD